MSEAFTEVRQAMGRAKKRGLKDPESSMNRALKTAGTHRPPILRRFPSSRQAA